MVQIEVAESERGSYWMELNGSLDQLELGARGERANVEQTNKKNGDVGMGEWVRERSTGWVSYLVGVVWFPTDVTFHHSAGDDGR